MIVRLAGVNPYDGDYQVDFTADLTTREWGWIKRLAGYLPLDVNDDAFGDPELLCVLAAIALRRNGRIETAEVPAAYNRMIDAPFGSSITVVEEPDEKEAEPRPPTSPESSSANGNTSGSGSPPSSETSASLRIATGTPGSDISASDPPTLAS